MNDTPRSPSFAMGMVPRNTKDFAPEAVVVIVCSSFALCSSLELLLLIFTTFKRWSGLYFWSILIASAGIIPYNIGYLIVYFDLTRNYAGFIIDSVGWAAMITGQSVVLYSRLHIILRNPNILRAVLWMIIVNGVVWHTTTTVVLFGAYLSDEAGFMTAYNIIEKLQMTIFCIQEFIISGLYVWKSSKLLRDVFLGNTRGIMYQLFTINVLIIFMDIALLALEYRNLLVYEQGFKSVIYAIKLKLEFAILGKLVSIVQTNDRSISGSQGAHPGPGEIQRTTTTVVTSNHNTSKKDRGSRWLRLGEPEAIHMENISADNPSPRKVDYDSVSADNVMGMSIKERQSSDAERESKVSKASDARLFRSISKQDDSDG